MLQANGFPCSNGKRSSENRISGFQTTSLFTVCSDIALYDLRWGSRKI
ncbi:hypothetical protein NEIMUCOT_05741 [Neisseria mucosa ATCC 25996]|uniref:Uncharacterized protein n=1 Tax=Neisseria mucosa (strain ATCC 25996 / DSM 4631 / NCTC 10774 / M26) TaxID=546266 RepID=D2ZYM7_NEIM2|nr:hypothetical protein NEIMUCOT_05741 [Neisseria mucosa ATCC 25996]